MTLILAANLSDRIYLAGDTRVSRGRAKDNDHQHKIVKINDQIAIGCAGSLDLIHRIVWEMKSLATPNMMIEEFIESLKLSIPLLVHDFITKTGINYNEIEGAKILIAGTDPTKEKTIKAAAQIISLVGKHQQHTQDAMDKLLGDREIESLTPEEYRRLGQLAMSQQMAMKGILHRALLENKYRDEELIVPTVYSMLYSLEIPRGDLIPRFQAHPWGSVEFAGSIKRSDIPDNFFMDIELNRQSGDITRDSLLFVQKIYQHFGQAIGGFVTPLVISADGIQQMFGRIHTINPDGTKKPLFETKIENGIMSGKLPEEEFITLKELGDGTDAESTTLSI